MATAQFMSAGTDETQDFSLFASTVPSGVATCTSDTSQALDGARSIKSASTVAGDNAAALVKDITAADTGLLVSAWYRFSTTTPATITQFHSKETAGGGSMVMGLALNTNGTIRFGGRGTTQQDGTTVLSPNTWYRISISSTITSTSVWAAKIYINGVLEMNLTNALGALGFTGGVTVSFGINNSSQNGMASPAAMTIWIDSMYIDNRSDLSDCGNVHVTAKRPVSNGTTNGFTTQIGAGGSGYGSGHTPQVNERPASTTNGWSQSVTGVAITEEYTIEGKAVGDVDISAATIIEILGWLFASAALAETASIMLGGATSNIALTSTNTSFTKGAGSATYPAGGTDIGIVTATTTTTVSLYEAGILVAYVPASVTSLPPAERRYLAAVGRAGSY